MTDHTMMYSEYFEVEETYFPCIDEAAIRKGVNWKATYPHETFINLLKMTEKMLSGKTGRSLWIHGAYGTGKSRCAYALQKILEEPEKDVREYWDMYEPLKEKKGTLEGIIGHKNRGILTVYRYASGGITTPEALCFAIQEKILEAIEKNKQPYKKGIVTLKEGIITWLEDDVHKDFFNNLLSKKKWSVKFPKATADAVIEELKKDKDVFELIENITELAREEGITAFSLTTESLCNWIRDIIEVNTDNDKDDSKKLKIVFIWDEFSGFFLQNRNFLDEFQKIVSLCEEIPFYLIIVTHPITSLVSDASSKDDAMSVVQQRFNQVEIALPSNIAFELIGSAFKAKGAAEKQWNTLANGLANKVPSSTKAVMAAADVDKSSVMKNMLPIHPMAALALKNIAAAFQSNQRSMFDFIKTSEDLNTEAFQWFIQNTSPLSDRPFLTVDMLWDFFYEKGKEYLSADIKAILGAFPKQNNLKESEQIVLKTILIMQAITHRLSGEVKILRPTDQALDYAFEGDFDEYESNAKNIAKALVNKGILLLLTTPDDNKMYSVAVLGGDISRIEKEREKAMAIPTANMVSEVPDLGKALELTPALSLRFGRDADNGELPIVTITDFEEILGGIKKHDNGKGWHFSAVLALAKTEEEAQNFRNKIKKIIMDEQYKNITIIDALDTPLGAKLSKSYAEFIAMSNYNKQRNFTASENDEDNAKNILKIDWKRKIKEGTFFVWNFENKNGKRISTVKNLHAFMETIVLDRFEHINKFDFAENLTVTQLKLTQAKQVSRYGMTDIPIKGLITGCQESVLGEVWNNEEYWADKDLKNEPIGIIKRAIDKFINDSFEESGYVSINKIYDFLETTYGFAPTNLTAFVIGFLLKEYKSEPYRSRDSEGLGEEMTPEKLAGMIGDCMGKNAKETYIVSLTPEEKSFFKLTGIVWGINSDACSSPAQVASLIQSKIKNNIVYPIWALQEVDSAGVYDIVEKYINLIQGDGTEAHDVAITIGKIASQRPDCAEELKKLINADNCKKGMTIYLKSFENGKLCDLAKEIGANNLLLSDIKKIFSVEHSAQWNVETGKDEIRKLIASYEFIKRTNNLLNVHDNTKEDAYNSWRERLKFIGISCESLQAKYPDLKKLLEYLLQIVNEVDILPDNMKSFLDELVAHDSEMRSILTDTVTVFSEIYKPYLDGFSKEDCEVIKNLITEEMFRLTQTRSNGVVNKTAEDYRNSQSRTQMFKIWEKRTSGTKNPEDWSSRYKTPILCCIDADIYGEAEEAFRVLNSNSQTESEIERTKNFLEKATFFKNLDDKKFRDRCFMKCIAGNYEKLLPDIAEIRSKLAELPVEPYFWNTNPQIREKIRDMALAKYNAGGSDSANETIDSMSEVELRNQLKQWIRDDMDLGVKFIK